MIRFLVLLACAVASQAASIVLYDGSLNTDLTAQGWSLGALNGGGGSYTQSVAGGATAITTSGNERAGYTRFSPIPLDAATGYRLDFTLQLDSESHTSKDRAGLSVLVVGSDRRGLELAFWTNEIWAQTDSPLFTHGETATFNTTARTAYSLTVLGNTYTLSAGGSPILTGALRNYSANGLPYNMPNLLFIGDDTYSANAASRICGASISDVPEPSTYAMLAAGLFALALVRRY